MTSSEIRNSFLKFFEERAHTIIASSPVVPYDDPTLLFANAGMNQFKDVFLGFGKRSYARAADTQKCIRVSGKHNDLEEVGRDTYHHTFFEMLGNWSFGDSSEPDGIGRAGYYKKEAIAWAWELLTQVWRLPKHRLWATVYKDDLEAEQFWKTLTDIDPSHVLRFGEKDNFWEMGETGPCGPCSEIHIDRTPAGSATADMVNAGLPEVMEIWNLVFIQYNREATGTLTPLPSKHVDTGMGFERICSVIQNKHSNYDTDVFLPIIHTIREITKQPYSGKLPSAIDHRQSEIDTSMRVIADHVRTLTFAIGDGALPGNEGRGYVLRRILRRAARFGRTLGMHEPFIYQLVPTLIETMSYIFPEIKSNQEHIQKVIKGEEESFNTTLDNGLKIFEELITNPALLGSHTISGEDAFKLYDTFGFPLDLTELMAHERGFKVNVDAFSKLMEEQKVRSRSSGKDTASVGLKFSAKSLNGTATEFLGYSAFEADATVIGLIDGYVVLDRTPFYAESGGQVGDQGILVAQQTNLNVLDTQKDGTIFGHKIESGSLSIGQIVKAQVDIERRLSIMRNHSATHLLHNALRRILGTHVHQAGSLVAPEYLRFDFAHFAKLSDQELADIESLVNEKIKENIPRTLGLSNIPFEEAKKLGALMFFGDKYGDFVNVVQFGDFSTEFCGGTHVNNTGEIGYFKIRSEGSVASGVRRMEAVTGTFALEFLNNEKRDFLEGVAGAIVRLEEPVVLQFRPQFENLRKLMPSPEYTSSDLALGFAQLQEFRDQKKEIDSQLSEIIKSQEKERAKSRLKSLSGSMDELIASAVSFENIKLVAAKVSAASIDELKNLGDSLRSKLGSGVGLLATILEDKVQLVCVVTDDLVAAKKIEAGKVVGAIAKLVGGGGGGRPHMATAGGKDISKLDDALAQTKSVVESLLRK
jgi:alanyl-tRNA synthetase